MNRSRFKLKLVIISVFMTIALLFASCGSGKFTDDEKASVEEKDNQNVLTLDSIETHQNDSNSAYNTESVLVTPTSIKDVSDVEIFSEKKFEEVFYKGALFETLDQIGEEAAKCFWDCKDNIFKDLDNDGYDELIILCEADETPYTRVLLFSSKEDFKLEFIEDLSVYGSIGKIFGFRTVNVYGDETNQILLNISVSGISEVVCILDYKNRSTSEAIRAGVGTNGAWAYVKDIDNDGVEEIIQEMSFEDIQNHVYTTVYKWDGKQFKSTDKWSYYQDKGFVHPSDPKLVVQNYIEDMIIGVPKEETLKLVVSENLLDRNLVSDFKYELIIYGFNYFIHEKSLSENQAVFTCENLELSLSKIDGKWIITNVKKVS